MDYPNIPDNGQLGKGVMAGFHHAHRERVRSHVLLLQGSVKARLQALSDSRALDEEEWYSPKSR